MAKKCAMCQRIRVVAIFVTMVAVLLLTMMGQSRAEVYTYIDDRGKKVFVGNLGQVPQKYRDRAVARTPSGEVSNVSSFSSSNEKAANRIREEYGLTRLRSQISKLETRVELANNQIVVPVEVMHNGGRKTLRMILDTGASRSVYYTSALAGLAYQPKASGASQVAGGGVVKTQIASLDTVKVGPYTIKGADAVIMEDKNYVSYDGLLGMDFLQRVTYEIDKERSLLIWNPKEHKSLKEQLKKKTEPDEAPQAAAGQSDE
ncbi:retropepsin-like aspartic protease family protein [Neptunomonas marina]|uniref:DUF4124 domain-containing protein n=1 Tax=Neptunomonas marina TaxID=1815562 RepID=A0A437QD57_9GAMM|nr:retropepsin-like aspartic protease [Neptunomonas marina]RVU32441.1 hypothetical protein EOE65_01990 [Neptunomonas marina]